MNTLNRTPGRICLLLLATLAVAAAAVGAEDDRSVLRRLRAERRAQSHARHQTADKATAPARFGLLVIPVDFNDARLPAAWDGQALLPRLNADSGESLRNYFRIASGGRLDLEVTLAPLVHLPESRRQYSDRYLNGTTRTRKLATESLTAVRDLGLEFRRLDTDGPDGVAGSGDDDGQVDGVLILHAGIGNENDPEAGLIQALQFFLDEPVASGGVSASFYAVASLQSGPGIWAHETAHLLGMEDRYDPILKPDGSSELRSVGGLGRFSLMSSGAWGTGGGYGAALPDAYSAAQLGWYRVRNLSATGAAADTLQPGEAGRVWTGGALGPEFFLMETRSPALHAPFDADVPGNQLLIYHIDENLAEGNWHEDGPYLWHLRVRLVEADNNRGLALGADDGLPADLFPGPLAVTEFGPATFPASESYATGPSRISLTQIAPVSGGIAFGVSLDNEQSVAFETAFVDLGGEDFRLDLSVRETGVALESLKCEVRVLSAPAHGFFPASGATLIDFPLVEQEPGIWRPDAAVIWRLVLAPDAEPQTRFQFRFHDATTTIGLESRWWTWHSNGQGLDFRGAWPGAWTIDHPDGDFETTWHRWEAAPWLTSNQDMVLACSGSEFTDATAWPAVNYRNNAHTTLTSGYLGTAVTAVRLTHAIEVEMLTGNTAMDGGAVVWVGPDGTAVAAVPLEGYTGVVAARSFSVLHGQAAFVGPELSLTGDIPQWQTHTFPVPAAGPGPWRLRLVFGANTRWRARGWFIADMEAVTGPSTAPGFLPQWDGNLHWTWPWTNAADPYFLVQSRPDDEAAWAFVLDGMFAATDGQNFGVAGSRVLAALGGGERHRHQVRVVGRRPAGEVASRAVVIYPDGGDGQKIIMGDPWPNPTVGTVRFMLDVPAGRVGTLRVFDLRGRLLLTRQFGPGQQMVVWDGRSDSGARAAAGVYYFRLEGTGSVLTRKVVLIH